MRNYQRCTRCVMDTTDPEIEFDERGICNHCRTFDAEIVPRWFRGEKAERQLNAIVDRVKREGINKAFDSIIGLSGGVDSSYLAMKAVELGLRPLIVHVDCGWNSEIAVKNIENLARTLELELHTIVIDWEEMRDLQLAYFRSGVADQDVPQDHAIFAALYRYAVKQGIRYVLNGSNFASESILPPSWGYNAMDSKNLHAIHREFGSMRLKKFPTVSFYERYIYFPKIRGMKVLKLLNYMEYDKEKAIVEMTQKVGWRYYGGKHHESRFTKFFQAYYLPEKFGYDKRLAHLSSLILAGQMSRNAALLELENPVYNDSREIEEDKTYVARKLGISLSEFEDILSRPARKATDFASNEWLFALGASFLRILRNRS